MLVRMTFRMLEIRHNPDVFGANTNLCGVKTIRLLKTNKSSREPINLKTINFDGLVANVSYFPNVDHGSPMFPYVYKCLQMLTNVYKCLQMFTNAYKCLQIITNVCQCSKCLQMFTNVNKY